MAFVRFFSATFWPAAMLRIALWAGQNFLTAAQAASKQPERYVPFGLKLSEKYLI
jgi:hypothetical protein